MHHALRALCALGLLMPLPAGQAAAAPQADDLVRRADDYRTMMEAETRKSPLCKGYLGRPVTLTPFATLAGRLSGPPAKGEYETTSQFQTRVAASGPRQAGVVALAVPLDGDYVRYDADAGAFMVLAGAFPSGDFSEAPQADMAATIAVLNAKDKLGDGPRLSVAVSAAETTTSTGTARNIFGAAVRTAEVDRRTRGLSLAGEKLFGFAKDEASTVTGFPIAPARAPAVKAGLRGALVVEPEAPYVVTNTMSGAAPTNRKPVHYTERATVVTARARCALVLDAQARVVASADAGAPRDGR